MASVWFSVIVFITINEVFGDVCLQQANKMTCDECIRCAGEWCNKPGSNHCMFQADQDWCPSGQQVKKVIGQVDTPVLNPQTLERTLLIGQYDTLDILYASPKKWKSSITIINSTQTLNIEVKENKTVCSGGNCTTTLVALVKEDFCSSWGTISEFVHVKVFLGLRPEPTILKYHVQCACECSLKPEKNSPICHNHGDLTCGVCQCHPRWTGEFCDKMTPLQCPENRGDVQQCMDATRMDRECYGNGYCNECETCTCYTDREGSQYFDEENNCADLCVLTSDCEDCLLNNTIGFCDSCQHSMKLLPYNETTSNERDTVGRKVWMKCNLTVADCPIDYVAMRDEDDLIYVMIVKYCNEIGIAGGQVAGSNVLPIVLGVLAALLLASAAGFVIWKHFNTVPPLPLNDPQYENIGAEDCTGENPLYKPPTSSFKNPTYGKW